MHQDMGIDIVELEGRVAMVTGAASGIGLALAKRLGAAGMRIALADIEAGALEAAAKTLGEEGIESIQVVVDVSDAEQMDRLAERVREDLGPAHVICLNAGVSGGGGPLETLTTADWQWGIGVNLWGVIHGLRVFLGDMKSRDAGHVVITSSIAGIINSPQAGPYHATKHAVAAIAEVLFRELHDAESNVSAHCLCPGLVASNFPTGDRNRPSELANPGAEAIPKAAIEAMHKAVGEIFARGVTTSHVAECVLEGILTERFWIYTDAVHKQVIRARHKAIENGEGPPTEGGALNGY
jgi:NADP-dependent 3-hydroxy acid dehydrogenase YdfG